MVNMDGLVIPEDIEDSKKSVMRTVAEKFKIKGGEETGSRLKKWISKLTK